MLLVSSSASPSATQNCIRFQRLQFQEKYQDKWKDGKTDRPYFIGPFQLPPGVQKWSEKEEKLAWSGIILH